MRELHAWPSGWRVTLQQPLAGWRRVRVFRSCRLWSVSWGAFLAYRVRG